VLNQFKKVFFELFLFFSLFLSSCQKIPVPKELPLYLRGAKISGFPFTNQVFFNKN
jgi:hypothetical protein